MRSLRNAYNEFWDEYDEEIFDVKEYQLYLFVMEDGFDYMKKEVDRVLSEMGDERGVRELISGFESQFDAFRDQRKGILSRMDREF